MKPGKPIRPTPQELALAQKLHAIGLEERRRVEGFDDGKNWQGMPESQCSAWCAVARALLNKEIELP